MRLGVAYYEFKEIVTAYFDSQVIKYLNSVDQPSRISLLFNTDNIPQITVNAFLMRKTNLMHSSFVLI